jgi:membrane-associated phospholipid phosphatase
MVVLIVFVGAGLVAGGTAAAVSAFANRDASHVTHGPVHAVARVTQRSLWAKGGFAAWMRRRISPSEATGLALLSALGLLVVVGVLAFEIRRQSEVVHLDVDIARWAFGNSTDISTRVLRSFTWLGSTIVVVVICAAVITFEVVRTRARGVVLFVLLAVGGANVATNLVKAIVERPRPAIGPLATYSGFSFPSGHSSSAAACFAVCALCLGRGRSTGVRTVLIAVAAAVAVMVATSRVELGVHWFSDALAGLCFGAAWFSLCAIAFGGRLLRFGAPVEAAVRTQDARVEVAERPPRELRAHDQGGDAQRRADDDVGQIMHSENHP